MDEIDELASFRPKLLRHAVNQLRDAHLTEDVVQDCLAAAITGLDMFNGGSTLETWVFSILANKIRNEYRSKICFTAKQSDLVWFMKITLNLFKGLIT